MEKKSITSLNVKLKEHCKLPVMEGYLYSQFIYSYVNDEHYLFGAISGTKDDPDFFLCLEPKKKGLRKLKTLKGIDIYDNHMPDRNLMSWLQESYGLKPRNTLSWIQEDHIFTIIPSLKLDASNLLTLALASGNKIDMYIQDLLSLIKYLPSKIQDWRLVTVIFWITEAKDLFQTVHTSRHILGTYKKEKLFLNLHLKFLCACKSCPKIRELFDAREKTTKVNGINFLHGVLPDFSYYYFYHDSSSGVDLTASDNGNRYEDILKQLMTESIELLTNYSQNIDSNKYLNRI